MQKEIVIIAVNAIGAAACAVATVANASNDRWDLFGLMFGLTVLNVFLAGFNVANLKKTAG